MTTDAAVTPDVAAIVAGLTKAQRAFVRDGKESVFADRRVTRALCIKGLMGHAGYVLGFDLHAFTPLGLAVRAHLLQDTTHD